MNRKNEILPENLDAEQIGMIFERIREHPEKPQSKRVQDVLELLSRYRADLRSLDKMQIKAGLDRILSTYKWSFMVAPSTDGWRRVPYPADRGKLSKDEEWGYEAIGMLIQLMPYLGKQSRIRRCANKECRAWMFAGNNKKVFHSGVCRQQVYDNKPENREYKRNYAKRHRIEKKERALKFPKRGKKFPHFRRST